MWLGESFCNRVDTLVDKLLEEKMRQGLDASKAAALRGKIAVANSMLVYQRFKEIFGGERFKVLAARGARVQRVLWASTSTKNPAYSDVLYVETLIGPDTVNTMPDETIVAFRDHGKAAVTVGKSLEEARAAFQALAELGYRRAIGEQLSVGVDKFAQSFDKLSALARTSGRNSRRSQSPRGSPAECSREQRHYQKECYAPA
jgi:transaldolase